MKVLFGAAVALVGLTSGAFAQSVPTGVYDCFGDIGKFSVIGPGRYMARDGGTGSFEFDGVVLTMTDGTSEGLSYGKIDDKWTFSLLRDDGSATGTCPLNLTKNPQQPNTW